MKNLILILPLILALLLPGAVLAAGMGQSAGFDLDQLWARAQKQHDLQREDAVLLLESRRVTFTHDGARQTRVHRVVWIGTSVGVRSYADLRVPWNSATSTLDVELLRTWRVDRASPEGRWWPDPEKISDTAVVHTLPHALDRADDYTDMRETMLLHDGVELGCIMETAYTITDRDVPAGGGVFVLPHRDPAVLVELRVMTPPGMAIQHAELNGAPAAESVNPTKGQGLLWTARDVPALRLPLTTGPEAYEPAVAWSTWPDWPSLAESWLQAFDQAAELDPGQAELVLEQINSAMSSQQKAAAVGAFLNEMVRPVRYSHDFWRHRPRPAARTFNTAYGHGLDRAVLAAAMLQAAGLESWPMLIGTGSAWPGKAMDIPRLQGMTRVVLRIPELGLQEVILDPADGRLKGMDETFGHPFYYIGSQHGSPGGVHPPSLPQPEKKLTVGVNLARRGDEGWQGEGFGRGQGVFSGYGSVVCADDLAGGPLQGLAGSLLPGAEVSGGALVVLRGDFTEAAFTLKMPLPGPDDLDRRELLVGRPAGGLLDRLPGDVHLYEESRQSPVLQVGGWQQSVTVRLEVAEDELLHRPEPRQLTNAAGGFSLTVDHQDGWLVLTRSLRLNFVEEGDFPAAMWPDLRALLLAESDPACGTVLLK
jgi:hypothetical protein